MAKTINEVETEIFSYIDEARKLLPGLPKRLTFVWDKKLIIPDNGTGGTLLQPTVLGIGYDPDHGDADELSKNLRATVLHECFHAVQGWSDENPTLVPETLLEDGVLEGAATVFERDYAETTPLWSDYENDKTMQSWLALVKKQQLSPESEEYFDFKFGKVDGVKWMLYKVGTWIVDKALAKNPELNVTQLAIKNPKQIIKLAGI